MLKAQAHAVCLVSVEQKGGQLWLTPYAKAKYHVEKIPELIAGNAPALEFKKSALVFEYQLPKVARKNGKFDVVEGERVLKEAKKLVKDFQILM